jgi:hypothetical protein
MTHYRTGNLFDERPEPRARSTDPETSHEAAARAKRNLTQKQRNVLDGLRTLARAGATQVMDEELVAHMAVVMPGLTQSSVRTRRKELVALGYVKDSGRKGETSAGGKSIRWELTGKVG